MIRQRTKRVVRAALVSSPRVHRCLAGGWRYLVLHRVRRVHEPEFRALPSLLDPAPVVVDVGGNVGQSVLSILAVLPDARITTFEPNPRAADRLRRLQRRFPTLRVEQCALGDVAGELLLHVPVYNGVPMSGLASLDPQVARRSVDERWVSRFRPDRLTVRAEPVAVRRLDDLKLAPSFVKIDVEGHEEQVVRGGLATLEQHHPALLIETPGPSLSGLLADLGYRAVEYVDGRLVPSRGRRTNQFFVRLGARASRSC